MRRGWQSGMSWGVRLAARMPAVRATPSTSPLGALPRRITRRVAGAILRTARATASRAVSRFSETSTMRAPPPGDRWERPWTAPARDLVRRDAGASVPDDRLHPVLGHQLQLLQLAHAPLLVRRERGGSPERLELLVVGLVLAAEAPELLVLGRQSLDEGLLVHARPPWVEGSQLVGAAGVFIAQEPS